MVDALVSTVLEKLASIIYQEIESEVRQVVGVRKEVQKLTSNLQTIRAVLVDAEKRQVTQEVVKVWLEKLKDLSYDMDDVLDEWSTAILKMQIEGVKENAPPIPKKVCSSFLPWPCFCFSQVILRRDISLRIKELKERLDLISYEKQCFNFKMTAMSTEEHERPKSTSFIDDSEIYGRNQDKKIIVNKLLCESSQEEMDLHIISIVGMGGIGKTTLAQLAYNDDDVKRHFEKRIWVCVSDPFDEKGIAKSILIALIEKPNQVERDDFGSHHSEILPERVHELIAGKKFLLVLDDVWTEDFDKWESVKNPLKSGAKGSRILVTTRNERVARMMGTTYMHPLEELSKELCRTLFNHIALFGRSREDHKILEGIGVKIADKCKGLPLAAKALGSLMRFKKTEQDWQNVLDSEIWELEAAEKGLFPALLLSYYDLPSALKQCFLFCAIFPKDHVIEKKKLIQLWMAQGYLSPGLGIEMEILGQEYFENLVMRSFFQDFEKAPASDDDDDDAAASDDDDDDDEAPASDDDDDDDAAASDDDDDDDEHHHHHHSIKSCKMHDIVHDFAQFLTKNECFIVEDEPSYRKGRHSTVILGKHGLFPVSIYDRSNLRTLLVLPNIVSGIENALLDIFHHLKCLRALDLSESLIMELPMEVGKLIQLRYLNLSDNFFENLPETLCDLWNLQTLDLSGCGDLKELPKGIGKLINLRHLLLGDTPELRAMLPKGYGGLISLRRLRKVHVHGGDDKEAFTLGDLEKLNNLQGSLEIKGLGNLENVGEAKKADLKSKKHLLEVRLDFSPTEAGRNMGEAAAIIEALQPHQNLESLSVRKYEGTLFPNWMSSLTKLRKLRLVHCRTCTRLPPLGKLKSLESLKIAQMPALEKVGVEFLGFGIDGTGSSKDHESRFIAFPMLKNLIFDDMEEWEEWEVIITQRRKEEEEEITIMPCLQSLKIAGCPKLKALPHHLQTTPLEYLKIRQSPILEQRCQEGIGEDWIKISHVPEIRIFNLSGNYTRDIPSKEA